jgi:hypothetical protein
MPASRNQNLEGPESRAVGGDAHGTLYYKREAVHMTVNMTNRYK